MLYNFCIKYKEQTYMKKNNRHETIKRIIEQYEISTQEELAFFLSKEGFDTTQATVSRDIKQMGLIKVSGNEKKFKYSLPIHTSGEKDNNANIFKASVLSIDYSLNMIVIKTTSGSAGAAAYFLDSLKISDILGSISGDDTIFIVVQSAEKAPFVVATLKDYMK